MSAVGGTPLVATPPTGFEAVGTPMLEVPKQSNLPASARLFTLRFVDNYRWHYLIMAVLALDFFGNCIAVSFTSTASFYKYGLQTRLGSSFCVLAYCLDMVLRLISMRGAIARSAYTLCDIFVFVLVLVALSMRFTFADNPSKLKVYTNGWTDSYHTNTKYRSNQIEIYLDTTYAFLVACRIVLKPRAREFSKKFHNFAHNDHICIGIESVRGALRRVPRITAMAIELLDSELRMVCGREEGDMSRKELLSFLERALQHRPRHMSADTFLGYLRDIDARSTSKHIAYGAWDVVRSTFYHWSSQKLDLALTTLVVLVSASILPLLAYFLQICTDEGFPSSVWTYALHEYNDMGFDIGLSLHHEFKWKNQTTNDNGTLIELPFLPWTQLMTGVIGIIGISIPFAIADYAMGYFQSKMIANATKSMQDSLFRVILRQPTQFFSQRSDGDLNNLFQSDIARVNTMWQAVFWNLMNPITGIIVGFTYLMVQEPTIGAMSFAFSAMIVTSGPQRLAAKKSQIFGSQSAYAAAEFQNAVACHKVVSAYGIENPLSNKFNTQTIGPLRFTQFSKDFWSGVVQIYIESGMFAFVACMTACLAIKVFHGDITSGQFFSSVTMLNRISSPVTILGGFMRVAIGNASSLQRLDDIIFDAAKDTENYEMEDRMKPRMPRMQGCVTVQNLSFKYDENHVKWILDDVNCIFQKGEYTCIVGSSGCGKSTLLSCLMQFYSPTCGSICIDTLNTQMYSKASIADQIAVVFQDGGILNGTILENIAFGYPDATPEECIEAARLAECDGFVHTLKDGYDTIIGQHAVVNLSGGQLQRICLARALVRKPSILLLDEATSALDPETEATIVSTLEKLAKQLEMTIISVTHRLSTARNADKILVMKAGRIIEEGTYNELLHAPRSVFAELVHKMEATIVQEEIRASRISSKKLQHLNPDPVYDTHRALELFGSNLDARAAEARSRSENGSGLAALRRSLRKSSKQGSLESAQFPMDVGVNKTRWHLLYSVVNYTTYLLGFCIILFVAMDTIVNNWVINEFIGDGYAFLTPIATVQNALQLETKYNFAYNAGLQELSKVGFFITNSTISDLSTKSKNIFVISVGSFPMTSAIEQCKIFQATYPLDLSVTPRVKLAIASNVMTYFRGNSLSHLFTNELNTNVAKAPINSAGLDAMGYVPGRTATDLRLTTGISLSNTSTAQTLIVPFYKINTRTFCSGCGTSPELGFGHCSMTFIYNDTTKSVVIAKSTNVLGSTYKVGIILPRSIFSTASYYVKFLAIFFAVGGFLASRKTVMWVEKDIRTTESIFTKIIHIVFPKSFNYPSHAVRFDMFCFNSDVFVFLFTISVLFDMQNSFLFLRFMNLYNAQTPSVIHYLQMAGLTTRLLWLNCTCLKLVKIGWSFISTASFNGDSKIMGFFNLTSVTSLYLSAIMLIEVPAYIEYNNSLNYDLNNKVENLDALHVTTFNSFYFRAVPALAGLMFANIFFFTALDQLWNRKKLQILSKNSLGRQALYNSSSILCDFLDDIQPVMDKTTNTTESLLMCKARRLSTLQWFFMNHLTCFGLQEKDLRNRKGKQVTTMAPGPSVKEDAHGGKCMVVQDGDHNVHLLDDQFVDVTSLVYNIKVLKDTNICVQ